MLLVKAEVVPSGRIRYSGPMRFGEYLNQAITKAGLSQRAFAKQVKSHQQAVNEIVLGRRTPPLARLEAWADALKGHIDRAVFLELARLEHSPPEIRTLVDQLRKNSLPK